MVFCVIIRIMNNKQKEFWDETFSNKVNYKEITTHALSELLATKNPVSSFLDLGCGTGSLMRIMELKGIETMGVEWSTEAIKQAEELGTKGKILNHNLDNIEDLVLDKKFDVISIKLVLAFITNKATLLKWSKEHLNEGGILMVNTPVSTKTKPSLKPGIAMKEIEVKNLLEMTFNKVTLVENDETGVGIVQTYFCS